jgi:amidophosphoribosyltransferase
MSEIGKFVAFEAVVDLLKESGRSEVLGEVYRACVAEIERKGTVNQVRALYDLFSAEEIAARIARLVRPPRIEWQGEIEIIFQTIEGLHGAVPHHTGDWYFTGHYPTPGGYRVVNQAYINYFERQQGRSY